MSGTGDAVEVRREGDVALIVMRNPPVNALGHALRSGLMAALDGLRNDAGLRCVVLAGSERAFSGGADIKEFGQPPRAPHLGEVIAALEGFGKPVVAAIAGTALGGGLELALGCGYRVAWAGTKLGLPEVKLGILPGAGGTQRLPRVIGVEAALRAIISGNPLDTQTAQQTGLVDAVLDGAYPDAAVAWAREHATEVRLVRDRGDRVAEAKSDPGLIERAAAPLLKSARNRRAAEGCVAAVRAAVEKPFDEGLAEERRLFGELVGSPESAAQRYAFFAEREAQKIPNLPAGVRARPVTRAAVIGAGTMGGGIAMCFAEAGIPVTVIETAQAPLDTGMGRVEGNYATSVKRGSMSQAESERRRGLIQGRVGLEGLGEADVIIEAVFEEMDVKKTIFRELDKQAKPGAVLASNTSYLDIDEIASVTGRPADVLGMHFFSPANVMKLLEVVRGAATSPETLATAVEVGKRVGKVPVVVGVCDGFVGNRMLSRRSGQAERLLLEGAAPQQVDRALTRFGFRMGPFAMGDLAGLDIGWRLRKARGLSAPVADALCEAGRLGQKTGRGYYKYEGRDATPDPEVDAIVADASSKLGISRREIDEEEILERLLYPMINEGARILDEGIAARPVDVDVIWLHGYNWPVTEGGPMHYADRIGLKRIAERLQRYAETSGDETLRPAPLLARLAAEGGRFADWRRAA